MEYFVPSLMALSKSGLLRDVGFKSVGKVGLGNAS